MTGLVEPLTGPCFPLTSSMAPGTPWDALGRPGTPWEHPCGWRAPEQPVTPTPQGAGIALGQQAEEPVLPPSHGVPLGDPAHCTIV